MKNFIRVITWFGCVLGFWIVCISCKSVSPTVSGERATPNEVHSEMNLEEAAAPKEALPQIIQWAVVTPKGKSASEGGVGWNLEVRTAQEIWCETRCSMFDLEQNQSNGILTLRAVKTPQVGNTTPGVLDKKQEVHVQKDVVSKVTLEHLGAMGNNIVLDQYFSGGHPNLYAVPMHLSAEGKDKSIVGEFSKTKAKLQFTDKNFEKMARDLKTGELAFAIGTLLKTPGGKQVFIVSKLIAPWSEE